MLKINFIIIGEYHTASNKIDILIHVFTAKQVISKFEINKLLGQKCGLNILYEEEKI